MIPSKIRGIIKNPNNTLPTMYQFLLFSSFILRYYNSLFNLHEPKFILSMVILSYYTLYLLFHLPNTINNHL